jgi:hypothetical protein
MSRFLKLTNTILNTNVIHKIDITPNKYCIKVVCQDISGSGWSMGGFGLCRIDTYTYNIEICKTEKPEDYKKVSDWIMSINV